MEIRIAEDNWTAELIVSPQSAVENVDFVHCIAKVLGKTEADALSGAKAIFDLFAKGRETFIRTEPEADTYTDFDTKEKQYRGYVRFSFRLEPGSWHHQSEINNLIPSSLGGF